MKSQSILGSRMLVVILALSLGGCAVSGTRWQPRYVVPSYARLSSSLYGYAQAVRVGPWITVSGQVGYNPKTQRYGATVDEQARLAFANLARVLHAAGASLDDVVSITTYQTDMSQLNAVAYERNAAFGDHRPAWTALGVTALALPELKFEVSAMAFVPAAARSAGGAPADPGQ